MEAPFRTYATKTTHAKKGVHLFLTESDLRIYLQDRVKVTLLDLISQVKLSFIVIPLHVGTYSGTKCRASQDHGAT